MKLLNPEVDVIPGRPADRNPRAEGVVGQGCAVFELTNAGGRVNAYAVRVECEKRYWNPDWVRLEPIRPETAESGVHDGHADKVAPRGQALTMHLNQGETRRFFIRFQVPERSECRAGAYPFRVVVEQKVMGEQTGDGPRFTRVPGTMILRPFRRYEVEYRPASRRFGFWRRKREYEVAVTNQGNDWLYFDILRQRGRDVEVQAPCSRVAVPPPEPDEVSERSVPIVVRCKKRNFRGDQVEIALPVSLALVDAPSIPHLDPESVDTRGAGLNDSVLATDHQGALEPDENPTAWYAAPLPATFTGCLAAVVRNVRMLCLQGLMLATTALVLWYGFTRWETTMARTDASLTETPKGKAIRFSASAFHTGDITLTYTGRDGTAGQWTCDTEELAKLQEDLRARTDSDPARQAGQRLNEARDPSRILRHRQDWLIPVSLMLKGKGNRGPIPSGSTVTEVTGQRRVPVLGTFLGLLPSQTATVDLVVGDALRPPPKGEEVTGTYGPDGVPISGELLTQVGYKKGDAFKLGGVQAVLKDGRLVPQDRLPSGFAEIRLVRDGDSVPLGSVTIDPSLGPLPEVERAFVQDGQLRIEGKDLGEVSSVAVDGQARPVEGRASSHVFVQGGPDDAGKFGSLKLAGNREVPFTIEGGAEPNSRTDGRDDGGPDPDEAPVRSPDDWNYDEFLVLVKQPEPGRAADMPEHGTEVELARKAIALVLSDPRNRARSVTGQVEKAIENLAGWSSRAWPDYKSTSSAYVFMARKMAGVRSGDVLYAEAQPELKRVAAWAEGRVEDQEAYRSDPDLPGLILAYARWVRRPQSDDLNRWAGLLRGKGLGPGYEDPAEIVQQL